MQPCTADGYIPLRNPARLGVQIGDWQYAFSNETPLPTRRSMFGVRMYSLPSARIVSQRCWSVQIQRMFGRSSAGAAPCAARPAAVPTKPRRVIPESMAASLSQAGHCAARRPPSADPALAQTSDCLASPLLRAGQPRVRGGRDSLPGCVPGPGGGALPSSARPAGVPTERPASRWKRCGYGLSPRRWRKSHSHTWLVRSTRSLLAAVTKPRSGSSPS